MIVHPQFEPITCRRRNAPTKRQ